MKSMGLCSMGGDYIKNRCQRSCGVCTDDGVPIKPVHCGNDCGTVVSSPPPWTPADGPCRNELEETICVEWGMEWVWRQAYVGTHSERDGFCGHGSYNPGRQTCARIMDAGYCNFPKW